jgi:hypothetical protein
MKAVYRASSFLLERLGVAHASDRRELVIGDLLYSCVAHRRLDDGVLTTLADELAVCRLVHAKSFLELLVGTISHLNASALPLANASVQMSLPASQRSAVSDGEVIETTAVRDQTKHLLSERLVLSDQISEEGSEHGTLARSTVANITRPQKDGSLRSACPVRTPVSNEDFAPAGLLREAPTFEEEVDEVVAG